MKSRLVERMVAAGYMKAEEVNNPLVIALRMLAFPVVMFCIWTKFHPNIVTSISLALGCSGAFFYFIGVELAFIVTWSASIVLDYTDGAVARKSGKESHFGYLFDMLGDRLKIISLVIAWSLVEGSLLGGTLAVLVISIFTVTEVVSHLFVQHATDKPTVKAFDENIPYQVFVHFHMHSFLIYGIALYLGGAIALMANAWLVLITFLVLKGELLGRVYRDGRISVRVNEKLLSKFTLYRSKDCQR